MTTTINNILTKIKKEFPNIQTDTPIEKNLLICEITQFLERTRLISFNYEYREDSSDSWIQVEYFSKINKTIIWDYDAKSNFENMKDFAETLINYEKEIKKFENNNTECPLCNSKLKYKKIENNTKNTHIYICPNCPFIGLEFYEYKNLEDLKKHLNNKQL